jgi:hypothetical protein
VTLDVGRSPHLRRQPPTSSQAWVQRCTSSVMGQARANRASLLSDRPAGQLCLYCAKRHRRE